MTNETEAPDLFSPYHDGSMQHDKDGGWVSIDDYNALSDAKDARIAELEAERDETMREALSLARGLHKTHYSDVTQWEPLDYPAGIISQIDNMVAGIVARAEAAEAKLAKAEEASIDVGASLAAAISLLERGGKKAAPSDKMFNQMLADYKASLDRLRATLAELEGETND